MKLLCFVYSPYLTTMIYTLHDFMCQLRAAFYSVDTSSLVVVRNSLSSVG